MIKSLAITAEGIEDISVLEIKEIANAASVKGKSCLEFEAKEFDDLFRLCYSSQSISKVMVVLKRFDVKKDFFAELKKNIHETDFEQWIDVSTKIAFRSLRVGVHDFKSTDIESSAASYFFEKNEAKVDLKSPQVIVMVYLIDETCFIGIDLSGIDLSKRDYKIFSNIKSLNPSIAYALVRMSGYEKSKSLLDPFSGSGEIAIEACLYACKYSVHFYSKDKFAFRRIPKFSDYDFDGLFEKIDKKSDLNSKKIFSFDNQLKNLMSVKKNAKIAGINKFMTLSRLDIDWLDSKLDKGKLDIIVTYLPDLPKVGDIKAIEKVIAEFFYQSEFILSPKGKIVAICRNTDFMKSAMKKYSFNVIEEKIVWQGKEKFIVSEIIKS